MTVTKTYLLYIIILLLFDLLRRRGESKPDTTNHSLQSDKGSSFNIKQKIVRYAKKRRQHAKTSTVWHIKMKTSQEMISAGIKDISTEGAFIVCQNPLPLKEQFRMAIDIPTQKPIALEAEVVWSNSNVPEDKVVNRGMGIKFLPSSEKVRKSLNKAIQIYQRECI